MNIVGDILYKDKRENLLVYALVFLGLWDFTLGFTPYTGGGFGPIVSSLKIGLLLDFLCCFLLLYHSFNRSYSFNKTVANKNMVIVFSIAYVFYITKEFLDLNIMGVLFSPIKFIILILFLRLRDDLKVRIFDGFIRVVAVVLTLSIVEYLIYVVTDQRFVLYTDLYYLDKEYRPYDQTLFNLMPNNRFFVLGNIFRFQSIAEEPGGLGTLCSFLLFATYGSKKYHFHYIVFWIAGLLSFSLAFYIMAFIHICCISIVNRNYLILLILAIILGCLYYFFKDVFDLLILDRIGGQSFADIDNRTAENFQRAYERAWQDGTIWFGYGTDTSAIETDGGTAGAKKMIFQYGVFRTIAIVVAYIYCYLKSMPKMTRKSKLMALSFLLVFWVNFYQRHYILSFAYVLPYFVMPFFISYIEKISSHK